MFPILCIYRMITTRTLAPTVCLFYISSATHDAPILDDINMFCQYYSLEKFSKPSRARPDPQQGLARRGTEQSAGPYQQKPQTLIS